MSSLWVGSASAPAGAFSHVGDTLPSPVGTLCPPHIGVPKTVRPAVGPWLRLGGNDEGRLRKHACLSALFRSRTPTQPSPPGSSKRRTGRGCRRQANPL